MASANPYRYAGYQYDEVTGLYYLMARYYDASVGRFITRDTFQGFENRPLSQNQYTYSENDPVNRIDPSGNASLVTNLLQSIRGTLMTALINLITNIIFGRTSILNWSTWAISSILSVHFGMLLTGMGIPPFYSIAAGVILGVASSSIVEFIKLNYKSSIKYGWISSSTLKSRAYSWAMRSVRFG